MHETMNPVEYYREALKESGRSDLESKLSSSIQGRIDLAMYLGIWFGEEPLPFRFEEEDLQSIDERLEALVQCAEEHIREQGFDYFDPWIPLLRFLRSVVMDRAFSDNRGSHPYSKTLRKRYRRRMKRILGAGVPNIVKRDKLVPPKLLEEFREIQGRLVALRPKRGVKTWTDFQMADYHRAFPELPQGPIQKLAKAVSTYRLRQGRRMGQAGMAINYLASKHGVSEHRIRDWLNEARIRQGIAAGWPDVRLSLGQKPNPRAPARRAPAAAHLQYLLSVIDCPSLLKNQIRKISGQF